MPGRPQYQLHWPNRYAPLWGDRQYRVEKERPPGPSIEEQVGQFA